MRTYLKWLVRGIAIMAVCAVLAAAAGFNALYSSLPAANGAMLLEGLGAPVRIFRDPHGVPHIEAASYEDAVSALGFVHAQDRLWQMHVLRMVSEGRLSELFGSATIDTDIFLRTVDLAGASRRSFEALSPEAKNYLTAYAEGVNAWLGRDTGILSARLPPEFIILGKSAEAWQPWHTIAILKVMALTLDSNLSTELRRLAMASRGFSPHEIDELIPYGPHENPPPLPDLRQLFEFGKSSAANRTEFDPKSAELAWKTGVTASNSWVVAGSRTTTGNPLLANDPHLASQTPTLFYLVHMAFGHGGENRQLVGASLPGTPLVLTGRNDRVAWGLTTANLDSQDLFVEKVNPDDESQYLTPDGWRPFETETVRIEVSGGKPVEFVRRTTRHGPVLPDSYSRISAILPQGHVGALQWVSLADDDVTYEGATALNLAVDVDGLIAATRKMIAPMQAIVAADRDGNIAAIAPGRVPVRDPANLIAGRAPVPGWLPQYDWRGYLAPDAVPEIINPANGALATANANWLPPGYSHHITYDWDEDYRQARIDHLIVGANEPLSPQSMRDTQADDYSPALDEFRKLALQQLEAGVDQDAGLTAAMASWDGRMPADSPLPLILTAWWRHTNIGLFADDLGEEFTRFDNGRMQPIIEALGEAGSRDWCDRTDTERKESCGVILAQALSAAMSELREMQGDDWRRWRWGKAHRALGEHRPFSSVALLAPFFAVTPESAGGSYTLLRGKTNFGDKEPYRNAHTSAYRAWYDLGDMDDAQYIIATGQSGHFLSSHYGDLAEDWANLRYIAIPTEPTQYMRDIEGTWTLTPKN
jgi:penicillin G amidase